LEISNNPGNRMEFKPDFKYIANIHGDEVVGREMMFRLVEYLLSSYGNDSRITQLINNTHIFIIPTINPDGYESCRRTNANGIDLNRAFPDQFIDNKNTMVGREKEVIAMMNFTQNHQFVLSACFHGGDVVVNYPYDGCKRPCRTSGTTSATDDTDVFKNVSRTYANLNNMMYNNPDNIFDHGITNGAYWYVLYGGMQDWNYVYSGCMEVTIELSCEKIPLFNELDQFWDNNKNSMISYIDKSNFGIRGYVLDIDHKAIPATIKIKGRNFVVYSDKNTGRFFRILQPGNYTLVAEAVGYKSTEITVHLPSDAIFVTANVTMVPQKVDNTTSETVSSTSFVTSSTTTVDTSSSVTSAVTFDTGSNISSIYTTTSNKIEEPAYQVALYAMVVVGVLVLGSSIAIFIFYAYRKRKRELVDFI